MGFNSGFKGIIFWQSSEHCHKRLGLCQPAPPRNKEQHTKPGVPTLTQKFLIILTQTALCILETRSWENTEMYCVRVLQGHSWEHCTKYKNLKGNFHNTHPLYFNSNNTLSCVYSTTIISIEVILNKLIEAEPLKKFTVF